MEDLVLVIGAGTMGSGIAQVCAQSGRRVLLVDISQQRLRAAQASVLDSLVRLARKGRIQEPSEEVAARIRVLLRKPGARVPAVEASIAIEAVPEELQLKLRTLREMEQSCPRDALLATNTSGIPISELARALDAPQRLVGTHFFNPVPLMRVVEVVRGDVTAQSAMSNGLDFVRSLGKEPLAVRRDIPGFVLNRISMAASNEAIRLVQDGVATAEEIDRGVKGAFGWKMGPLETADLVGLDVVLGARTQVFELTGDPRFEPPQLVERMVREGHLGRKAGRGFYDYGGS